MYRVHGAVASETHLKTQIANPRLSITYHSFVKSLWQLVQSAVVSVWCSVQICQAIWQLNWMFLANEILRDWNLRWDSAGYPIWQQRPGARNIFHKGFMRSWSKPCKHSYFSYLWKQRSGHATIVHIVELSWYKQIYDLIESSELWL